MVRPYAQTSRDTLLARGPRVAQASTVNSPNTDMNLVVKKVRRLVTTWDSMQCMRSES